MGDRQRGRAEDYLYPDVRKEGFFHRTEKQRGELFSKEDIIDLYRQSVLSRKGDVLVRSSWWREIGKRENPYSFLLWLSGRSGWRVMTAIPSYVSLLPRGQSNYSFSSAILAS